MGWLNHGDPLGALDAKMKRDLMSLGVERRFQPGDTLFPNALFPPPPAASHAVLIREGLVKLTATSADGHETLLSAHGRGALLGEEGALRHQHDDRYRRAGDQNRRVVATALTAVTARAFPSLVMRKFLLNHPEVLAEVALGLSERLEDAESRIASTGRDNPNRRLAQLFCDLERYGSPWPPISPAELASLGASPTYNRLVGTKLPISLSQADLASCIGTCQETVGRALRAWRRRGIVSTTHRTIVVRDLETLARIAGVQVSRRSWNWPTMRPAS